MNLQDARIVRGGAMVAEKLIEHAKAVDTKQLAGAAVQGYQAVTKVTVADLQTAPSTVWLAFKNHPTVAKSILLFLGRTAIFKVILYLLGFGPLGPMAGTLASFVQGWWYYANVPAGSVFAILQRLAMTLPWL